MDKLDLEIINYWKKCKKISETQITDEDFFRQFHKKSEKFYIFTYKERLLPVVKKIKPHHRILELGCGTGIDSILFSYFANKVIGIDIAENRIKTALQLKKILQRENVTFLYRDVFSYLRENLKNFKNFFNIIWITEAISHIHPLEELFPLLHTILNKDGYLIISESNILNPVFRKYIFRERVERYKKNKLNPEKYRIKNFYINPHKFIDPATKKIVIQANERMLSPFELIYFLKHFHFRKYKIYYKAFLHEKIFLRLPFSPILETLFSAIPLLKYFGIRYIAFFKKKYNTKNIVE